MTTALEADFHLFSRAVPGHDLGSDAKIRLIACLEEAHAIADGVNTVLTLLTNSRLEAGSEGALSEPSVDSLEALCRTTLRLLVEKIELTAQDIPITAT